MRPASIILLLGVTGCAENSFVVEDERSSADSGGAGDWDADADADADSDTDDDWGSEDEDAFTMLQPATTWSYVFVVNPDRDTVSRITVPSLEVITVEVGRSPSQVETTADQTLAVVFNEGSDDLSVIDAETLDIQSVALRPNLDSLTISPDGHWALAFRDADLATGATGGGVESFNEISLVNLDTLQHFPMVVGQNPRQVKYTDDSTLALVVSDAEVALIDLTAETPSPVFVEIAEDPLDPKLAEEIEIAPDGSYAFVRQYDSNHVLVLDLLTTQVDRISVGYNPTDLDILPDGSKAAVVTRGSNELWLIDVQDPLSSPPEVLELPSGEVMGSLLVTPDSQTGLLYTTAAATDRYAIWDIPTSTFTVRSLVKPVLSMAFAPDGETVLIFHTKANTDEMSSTSPYYDRWALTLMKMADLRQNPLVLADEPTAWAHLDGGEYGFFIMEGEPHLVVLDYATLLPEDVALKSLPLHVGTLPGTSYAYASQEHDLGRISFYDVYAGTIETITGFELNSGIE